MISYHLLTPRSRVLLEKLTGYQLIKKFPTFYGTRKFITTFTRARRLSLSWVRLIQSMPPHPTSWRSILILSSHLRLGIPSSFLPSDFPIKTLYMPLISIPKCYMPRPSHYSRFNHPNNIWWVLQMITHRRLQYCTHVFKNINFVNFKEDIINPYPTAFPYGNGMVLHFYQQQESSTTKTVHKVINKGLKTYV